MNPTAQTINPEEEVTLVWSKSKRVERVKRSKLKDYGLPEDYISNADTYAKSVASGAMLPSEVPETYRTGALRALEAQGYTPKTQVEREIEASKAKAKPAAQALSEGIDKLKQQAKNASVTDVVASKLTGGNIGVEADLFDQSKKLLGQTVAKLYENGRLSDKDRDFYQNEILKLSAVGSQSAIERRLDNLREEVLRQSGYKPEDFKRKNPEKDKDSRDTGSFVGNVERNVKDIGSGLVSLGQSVAEQGAQGKTSTDITLGMLPSIGQGLVSEGGKFLQDPVNYAYENPVDVGTALLPPIKGATTVTKGIRASKLVPTSEKIATGAENVAERITGGGTKELIEKNVMLDDARSMSKTLLDKNILNSMDTKGKIVKTQQALVDEGRNIEKSLKNAKDVNGQPLRYESNKLAEEAGNYLTERYGAGNEGVIQEVVDQMAKEGKFTMSTGSQVVDPLAVNAAKTGLYDYGLRQLGIGEAGKIYKQMANDLASFLRQKLATDVPEATPYLREYGNLRTYLDDVLQDPSGLDVKAGFWSTVANLARAPIEKGVQKVYNMSKPLPKINNATQVPATSVQASQALPAVRPSAKPVEKEVIEKILRGKGEPQATRLVRDNRYKQGNPKFKASTKERKASEKFVSRAAKKRYK